MQYFEVLEIIPIFVLNSKKYLFMPTLFFYLGLRFFFYSNDHEPIHVHVSSGDAEAKFRIEPEIVLIENSGLKSREIRQAIMAIEENKEVIIERWKEYFEQ